jgi:hypothetical protein
MNQAMDFLCWVAKIFGGIQHVNSIDCNARQAQVVVEMALDASTQTGAITQQSIL